MTAPVVDKLPPRLLWFANKNRFDIDWFDLLQPRRTVSQHPRYKSGLYRSEKCGRDMQYESALELDFMQRLERMPRVVFYWEQPVRIPYRLGRRSVLYTPDYGIYLDTGHVVLAEVKALPDMLDFRVQLRIEALMAFCSARGFGLLLTDGRHGPEHLMKARVNRRFEKELLAALDLSPLGLSQCRQLMEQCGATPGELYKAVIRHDLKFRPFPLKLRRGNDCRIFRQVFFGRKKYDDIINSDAADGILGGKTLYL